MRLRLAALLLAFTLAACAAPAATSTPTGEPPLQLLGTAWTLTALNGQQLIEHESITLALANNYLGGRMTCNAYGGGPDSGPYTATAAGDFHVRQLAVTVQGCADPALTEQEQTYLSALQQATHYAITDDTLTLSDDSGIALLTYQRQTDNVPNQ